MPEAIEQLRALLAENAKLRAENQRLGGATTMMGCKQCGRGVRPRDAVHGMCADCAAKRITELETVADAAQHAANHLCEMFDDNDAMQIGATLASALGKVKKP